MGKVIGALAFAMAALFASDSASAQYPTKPVRLVVGFPPGGLTDALARIVAQAVAPGLGQAVIVEHKPGADSTIAAGYVARSAADGYTLFWGTTTYAAAAALHKKVGYDPVEDFTPLSRVGNNVLILFSHSSMQAATMDELLAHARAHPGEVSYGSGNLVAALATAQIAQRAGVRMVHVPYKGEATLFPDLVAGRVQLAIFATVAQALPLVKDGRLRALALVADARSPLAPSVPTLAEAGYPNVIVRGWHGVLGPAKLSPAIAERLSREINVALARPEVQEQLVRQGLEVRGSTPAEFGAYLRSQLALWKQAVNENQVTGE
jgi:tripartite-type tricarboxylate transporter receptor subunit TctC